MLLKLCFSGGRGRLGPSPTLKVEAPLYRQGPGYIVWSGFPVAGSVVAVMLAGVPLPLLLLHGAGRFIK
jgi:hypothetical protein